MTSLYRLLLHFYPASFRAEYGEEMRVIFERRRSAAASVLEPLRLLAGEIADVVPNAVAAHAEFLRQDSRYTMRTLARSPGFAATAILVTALGIGATTATFSIADYVLLRPLPFREPERLVKLWQDESFRGYTRIEASPGNYRDWKRRAKSFEAMAAYRTLSANLVGEGDPARVSGVAIAGGALGLALAAAAVPLAGRLVPSSLPISELPRLDLSMLVFALVLAGATGVPFGVVPALRACADAETGALREGARAGVERRTERLRVLLVVTEVTASVALLIGAGLLLRALWRLQSLDPGFRSAGVLTMRTTLPLPRYAETLKRVLLYRRILSTVRALPGVANAAYTSGLPMAMRGGIWGAVPEGQPQEEAKARTASLRYITPGFFDTMGIVRLAGRDVAETDTAKSPYVAVVSESFARRHWPGESPLGRRFKFALSDREVAGVVRDVRVRGHEQTSEPQVYVPYQQVPDNSIIGYVPKDLVVRASIRPASLLPASDRERRSPRRASSSEAGSLTPAAGPCRRSLPASARRTRRRSPPLSCSPSP